MKISRPQYGLQQEIVEAIYALRDKKSSDIFREPVDPKKVVDYYQKIKNPMDLTTILKKLKQGKYKKCQEIRDDLQLIISNCHQYNMLNNILKKADQFEECINTVWGNFKKEIDKKGISQDQEIMVTDEILKRIGYIEQKKNKKKITALQSVIEQDKKNILPESAFLPKIQIENEKSEKDELPLEYQFRAEYYMQLSQQEKKSLLQITLNREKIIEQFEELSKKKLKKYRKIIKKKLNWFDKKIIQKCLLKKRFKKMQVPNHLSSFLEKQKIGEELNIRKLQMYIKQITYWIEDNSTILSDYMKDRFVDNCKQLRRSIIRVIKYRKIHRPYNNPITSLLEHLPPIKEPHGSMISFQEKEENDNYENKMKEFKRMQERDRGSSAKRDTKIILKNQNGEMQVIDWTNEKKQVNQKSGGGNNRTAGSSGINKSELLMNENDFNQKKKNEERRREQLKRDEQFIEEYQKKSNVLLIGKYGVARKYHSSKLQIDWEVVKERYIQFPTEMYLFPES